MAVVISELTVEIEASDSVVPFADYGINSEENLQKLLVDLEIAEERRKRLNLE